MSITVDDLKLKKNDLESSIKFLLQSEIDKFISETGITPRSLEIGTSPYFTPLGREGSFKIMQVEVGISI